MRKKINIQKDVSSREQISSVPIPFFDKKQEGSFETKTIQEDAKSEVIQEPENNESAQSEEKPKKRGRTAKGNL